MKMNITAALLATIFFTACETPRYAYSPSAHNVPVITQKGDGKIGAVYSTNISGERSFDNERVHTASNGLDVQGAYALSDNWAIQASHFQRWERTTGGPDSATIKYRRNLTELGGGYYFPMNTKKTAFLQVFGGGGFGRFSFTDQSVYGDFFHQSDILKFYIQPAFVFRSKGSFSTSIAIRGSIVKFNSIKTNYNPSIALSHTGTFQNNKIKPGCFTDINGILHGTTQGSVIIPGGQASHVCSWMINCIHTYPVSQ